jgi:hypothetical protein
MSEIVLRVRVLDHSGPAVKDTYWQRSVETGFIPTTGDDVLLWGVDDGPAAPVKRRWWRIDGRVCVELVPVVLNGDNGSAAMKDGRLQWVPMHRKSRDLAKLLGDAGWEVMADG